MSNEQKVFIKFEHVRDSASGVTKVWDVLTVDGGLVLGQIGWFGRWRCYAFYSYPGTVLERHCLRAIADFCETETALHRGSRRKPIVVGSMFPDDGMAV